MSKAVADPGRCPHCQAEVFWSDASQCWMCGQALDRSAPPAGPPPPPVPTARSTFGLSSVMLVIALIAVCLGVVREVPWLGIVLAITVAPALVLDDRRGVPEQGPAGAVAARAGEGRDLLLRAGDRGGHRDRRPASPSS